jgi:transposase
MRQRLSEQTAHSNEARENLEREVAKAIDASFDTFERLVTLEATGSVEKA